jgi:hypothetical protein
MIKILAISKSERHGYLRLEKAQVFVSGFRRFLTDLGFSEYDADVHSFGRPLDKDGEPDDGKEDDVKGYVDRQFEFDNGEYVFYVVFGKDSIFVIFFTATNRQKEIMEAMSRFCSF